MSDIPFHILVRVDANHVVGLAHAIRVSEILPLLSMPHRLTVIGEGNLLAEFFPDAQIEFLTGEPNNFSALVRAMSPDLVLVDHPHPGCDFWSDLRRDAVAVPIVAIDDFGGELDADLIINGTVLHQYHHYPNLKKHAKLKVGAAYSLVRPIFSTSRWRDPADPCVLIIVGSGDRARDWALQLVIEESWGPVKMIVGRAFPDLDKLIRRCDGAGVALETGLSGEKMASAMSQASLVLITGGMIVYESIAVGVPAVVFPQIDNTIPEAHWFAQKGCITDLGFDGGMDPKVISSKVRDLLSDPSMRNEMSMAQAQVIDGLGMFRAASAINAILDQRIAWDKSLKN